MPEKICKINIKGRCSLKAKGSPDKCKWDGRRCKRKTRKCFFELDNKKYYTTDKNIIYRLDKSFIKTIKKNHVGKFTTKNRKNLQ